MIKKLRYRIGPEELSKQDYSPVRFIELDSGDPRATHVMVKNYVDESGAYCSHFRYFYDLTDKYGQLDGGKGYVYILENKTQPGVCKIGSTTRTPDIRCNEINRATGVLSDYEVTGAFACKAPICVERLVHEELKDVRITSNKEGFYISREKAEKIIQRVIEANKAEFKI